MVLIVSLHPFYIVHLHLQPSLLLFLSTTLTPPKSTVSNAPYFALNHLSFIFLFLKEQMRSFSQSYKLVKASSAFIPSTKSPIAFTFRVLFTVARTAREIFDSLTSLLSEQL